MKKIVILAISLISSVSLFSQGMMDAYKMGGTEILGTARSMGMAGSFGALGGDASSLSLNPAGLGIYRSNEFVISPMLRSSSVEANWNGLKTDENKTRLSMPNAAIMLSFRTGKEHGLANFNIGFALNRLANFDRKVTARGNGLRTSITDYMAYKTNSTNNWYGASMDDLLSDDAYSNGSNWMSALAAGSGMIVEDENVNDFYSSSLPAGALVNSRLGMREKGWIDEYAIAAALNFENILYAGLTLGIQDLRYSLSSLYSETLSEGNLSLGNYLETNGTGWNLKLGVIVRPVSFMRFGIAYHTPTFYKMEDYYYADAATDLSFFEKAYSDATPEGVYSYDMRTPGHFLFSYALVFGKYGSLNLDYDLANYAKMKYDENDYDTSFDETNDLIKSSFKNSHTVRLGLEFRLKPTLSLRLGCATTTPAVEAEVKDELVEVMTPSILPHYTIDNGRNYYTMGLGYRFKAFFVDLAYVYKIQKEKLYSFSPYFSVEDDPMNYDGALSVPPYGLTFNEPGEALNMNKPAKLNYRTHSVVLTLGLKF